MNNIEQLRNIGPTSARMLEEIGVTAIADLRELGSVNAFIKLKFAFPDQISLNFLWAMHAGLQDRDWRDLDHEEKGALKTRLATMENERRNGF